MAEQALESGADGGFVGDAEVVELAQGGVVILDRLVRGLQFQPLHGGVLHQRRGGRQCWCGVEGRRPCAAEASLFPSPRPLPFRSRAHPIRGEGESSAALWRTEAQGRAGERTPRTVFAPRAPEPVPASACAPASWSAVGEG